MSLLSPAALAAALRPTNTLSKGSGAPAAFTMSQLALANRVYQRSALSGGGQGKGQGVVPVTISGATAGYISARARSPDGSTILQAEWIAATVAGGDTVANIGGVDARLGWFYLDLKGADGAWKLGTTLVGMGALALMSGQSLMVRMFKSVNDATTLAAAGVAIEPNGRIFGSADTGGTTPTAWLQPSDAGPHSGAGAAELLTRYVALMGVNVGLVGQCQGQTAISEWLPGQTLGNALLATADAAGGKFEIVDWFQGHSDSNLNTAPEVYKAALTMLFTGIAAHNSFATPLKLVSSIPTITTGWGGYTQIEATRNASYEWAVANGAVPVLMADLELYTDGVHEIQVGSKRAARHRYRAARPTYGQAHDDKGAVLGPFATHASGSKDIVIPFTLPAGATALTMTGAAAPRFKVYLRNGRSSAAALDGTTPIAIDNTAKTITLTLASDPGQVGIEVLVYGAYDPAADGSATGIYDDLVDGDGITQGRHIFASPFPITVVPPRDLTLTSPVYGAGKFGNTLTGGRGSMPNVATNWVSGMTVEAWLCTPATPAASSQVILGQNGAFWIGTNGTNLLVTGGSTTKTYAGALSDGLWHHIALVLDTDNTFRCYIDGVDQGSPWNFAGYNPTSGALGVRAFGEGSFAAGAQLVDEVAVFKRPRYRANFTPPTVPYVGNELGLVGLWHLNGDGLNAAA